MGRIFQLANARLKNFEKINRLLTDIDRNGYQCTGKPEPLSGNLAGYWSVHIDEKNRIVFRIDGNNLEIIQCSTHYVISTPGGKSASDPLRGSSFYDK